MLEEELENLFRTTTPGPYSWSNNPPEYIKSMYGDDTIKTTLKPYSKAEMYRVPISNLTIKAPLPPELRENTSMNTVATEQAEIDAAVREAIAGPRRLREIALRVAAVNAIGIDDTHEVGTVLRFDRKCGANVYSYAVLKAANDKWYMTGANASHSPYTWESLTEWMTTGENLITNLQVSADWDDITWSAPEADAS